MDWYEAEVQQLETQLSTLPPAPDRVVFYGSSSIRLWTTLSQDFPQLNTLNLGFGGSTLEACSWFFERLVVPANPKSIVFYAGDNDLGDGRQPEDVYRYFCTFAEKMRTLLPDSSFCFLSIKVSPVRWSIADKIRLTNQLICAEIEKNRIYRYIDTTTPLLGPTGQPCPELFELDGLHLSQAGYDVWRQVLREQATIF